MKTPEQIADEHIWRITDAPDDTRGREWIRNQIITAIEADRAQRPTLDREEFEQITEAMGALVRGLDRGVEYVTLVDAEAAERALRDKFGPALYDDWSD